MCFDGGNTHAYYYSETGYVPNMHAHTSITASFAG